MLDATSTVQTDPFSTAVPTETQQLRRVRSVNFERPLDMPICKKFVACCISTTLSTAVLVMVIVLSAQTSLFPPPATYGACILFGGTSIACALGTRHYFVTNLSARELKRARECMQLIHYNMVQSGRIQKCKEYADQLIQRSANRGYGPAEREKAHWILNKTYNPVYLKNALLWMSQAAEHGDKEAAVCLHKILQPETPIIVRDEYQLNLPLMTRCIMVVRNLEHKLGVKKTAEGEQSKSVEDPYKMIKAAKVAFLYFGETYPAQLPTEEEERKQFLEKQRKTIKQIPECENLLLSQAVSQGSLAVVNLLLKRRSDILSSKYEEEDMKEDFQIEQQKLLYQRDFCAVDLNAGHPFFNNVPPILIALRMKRLDIVNALIKAGASTKLSEPKPAPRENAIRESIQMNLDRVPFGIAKAREATANANQSIDASKMLLYPPPYSLQQIEHFQQKFVEQCGHPIAIDTRFNPWYDAGFITELPKDVASPMDVEA